MRRLALVCLAWLLVAVPSLGAAEKELPKPSDLPVEVTALHLEALQEQRKAIFTGEVVAKQGDMSLYCDKLVVYSLPDQDQVDRLEAFGRVRVVQGDRTATADQAIYRHQQGTLELRGNAQVHQAQNQVSGEEIMVYLQEDRSVVKSGEDGRVRAILYPEKKSP